MKTREKAIEKIILICAAVSTLAVALITIFIFSSGFPVLKSYGVFNFIFGENWRPTGGQYGILPLIAGTLGVTLGALIIGIPTGLGCAVFLAEMLKKRSARLFKAAIELLAGIPSVVYGFFGLAVIVPVIREYILPLVQKINPDASSSGFSVLAGAIILAIMILPTIVSISENSISAVPREFREASLALGADKRETITKVILPAAKSGIFSSIILAMGRAIGETMAVLLITGNMAQIPGSPLDSAATLTGTIAMEMSYATPEHQSALFAIGIILFVIIVILNSIAQAIMRKFGGMTA
ncbi:phosphate ABC transporter permease subunit PstC [Anaerovorax odorimutans]|uniref:Phosphate transport system permease protein n=1 Tax=Anaerovorax odorimutans TaxID=109327 RepID=A0ABT1RKB5_9FIRM|nr:phosphate ABC transporter permease subunit PstC [Anaerovorax odorimutans]MCQ4635632.1 phosphate ABC transporter permease subunit PstC [Anaerovorax odorimutans]